MTVHEMTTEHDELEAARLAAVARYEVLDSTPEAAFDRIAGLAARLLGTPYATVSLVDANRIWFKAAHGLPGMTQVARVPGLCASAIEGGEPYVVRDASADPRTAAHPLVRGELGLRFYAAAPITTADGFRLGTVDVFDTRPREVGADQLAMLTDLAAVVMDQLEMRLSKLVTLRQERNLRERVEGFASTLQRCLLPPSLPAVPGLELACHYYAASVDEVTGDFYDVFSLGDGRWAFFLGDVTGHGAHAAAVTSLVRYTLRAAALHDSDPAAALDELNAVLLLEPHVPQHCTVLLGILTPRSGGGFHLTLAGGGHPPALLVRPGGAVEELWPDGGMLVGAFRDATFATCEADLRPGQALLLYTDGLTEARPGGEFYGEDRLRSFLSANSGASARGLIGRLADLLDSFRPAPDDDVALLALRVPGPA